jgi:hypothetical protein
MACVCGHVCLAWLVCVDMCVLHGLCRCWVQVRDVRATAPKAAVERVRVANRQRRDQLLEESAAQASKMAIERAEEQARKDDLIRQIRALEKVPKPKVGVGPHEDSRPPPPVLRPYPSAHTQRSDEVTTLG